MPDSSQEILAFEYSGTQIGKDLFVKDLQTEEQIESLFDLSQILKVYITAKGWEYLFNKFGLYNLYKIDLKSGWHETDNETTWIKAIIYVSLCCGYNPIDKTFGDWDEESNIFKSEKVQKPIDWKQIETLNLKSI